MSYDSAACAPNILWDIYAPPYNEDLANSRREKLLTKSLSVPEKMELYNTSTKGHLDELRNIHNTKKYSLVEEVSKAGYYWTVFHYASHYGHVDVL